MAKQDIVVANYETALGQVELDTETVKQYLVKGNGAVTDQEVFLFIKMCQAQKLNPFVTGEVYLIKFGSQPAQMVVGYDTYKRRADENPDHLYTESGIVVQRGGQIVQKAGACLYPTEVLVGGWCRAHKLKNGVEVTTYKEVGFAEYNKGNAIWKEKPCTMIEKVAISQCLREAYPKDFEGIYTPEELAPAEYVEVVGPNGELTKAEIVIEDPVITQEERQYLFTTAQGAFGKEEGNALIKTLLEEEGLTTTTGMLKSVYERICKRLLDVISTSQVAQ